MKVMVSGDGKGMYRNPLLGQKSLVGSLLLKFIMFILFVLFVLFILFVLFVLFVLLLFVMMFSLLFGIGFEIEVWFCSDFKGFCNVGIDVVVVDGDVVVGSCCVDMLEKMI